MDKVKKQRPRAFLYYKTKPVLVFDDDKELQVISWFLDDIESMLDAEPAGEPISIRDAYVLRIDYAVQNKSGFSFNAPIGEFLKTQNKYVKLEPGDIEYIGPKA